LRANDLFFCFCCAHPLWIHPTFTPVTRIISDSIYPKSVDFFKGWTWVELLNFCQVYSSTHVIVNFLFLFFFIRCLSLLSISTHITFDNCALHFFSLVALVVAVRVVFVAIQSSLLAMLALFLPVMLAPLLEALRCATGDAWAPSGFEVGGWAAAGVAGVAAWAGVADGWRGYVD
jgi:hypothetical protein